MNRFTRKRVLSLLMTGSLMLGMSPSVLALDGYNGVKDIPGVGNSEVTLTVENTGGSGGGDTPIDPDNPDVPPVDPTIFSAYVPAELPIKMDLDGNIIVPDNAMIINAVETKGICVTDIGVTLESGWSASNWEDDFSAKEDNSKELGLKLRSDYLNSDGSFSLSVDDWKIPKNSFIDLNMGAKLSKQTEVGSKGKVATISFTLDWSGDDVSVGPEIPDGNPNGGSSGGGSETPEEPVGKVSVKFVSDENGSLEGETNIELDAGAMLSSFPTPKPVNIAYEFDKWVDNSSNEEVSTTTPISSDITIKAVFKLRPASSKNWFTTDGANTITGLSDEYLNMVDAPTDLVIPDTIEGRIITKIGEFAFENLGITSIVIPNTVATIGECAFTYCTNLINISIPNSVTTIGESAFDNCSSLSSIIIPDNVITVGNFAFLDCSSLKSVIISDSMIAIKQQTFANCISLSSVKISNSITTIESDAFAGCTGLNNLTIPNSVTFIGEYALDGVPHIVYNGTATGAPWGAKSMN